MALVRWKDPFSLLPRPFWNWPSLFEDGRLWIKAEATRDEKGKHYFVKGRVSYNYNVAVPNEFQIRIASGVWE